MSDYILPLKKIKKLIDEAYELALSFPDPEGFQKEVKENLRKPGAQNEEKHLALIKSILIDLNLN